MRFGEIVRKIASNRFGLAILPSEIESTYETLLKGIKKSALRESIQRIHQSLTSTGSIKLKNLARKRAREGNQQEPYLEPHVLSYDKNECLAYVGVRAIPTYGAISAVLKQLEKRVDNFKPNSIMDYGCGPGSAVWAARQIWGSCLKKATFIDLSESMLEVSQKIHGNTIADGDQLISKFASVDFKRYLALSSSAVFA
jgi:ribosomal protein RSM22 (predicted rRNA methylase)